jgi:hypothetical protein
MLIDRDYCGYVIKRGETVNCEVCDMLPATLEITIGSPPYDEGLFACLKCSQDEPALIKRVNETQRICREEKSGEVYRTRRR